MKKESIKDLIQSKILEAARKEPRLTKRFKFNATEFYEERVISEIEKYILENSDKIEEFDLDYKIDSDTFAHVIEMRILPVKWIRKSMTPHLALLGILPVNDAILVLREKIQKMLMDYEWEFNRPETRKSIIQDLQSILGVGVIIDKTTPENVDNSILNLFIKDDDEEISINDYIKKIARKWKKE